MTWDKFYERKLKSYKRGHGTDFIEIQWAEQASMRKWSMNARSEGWVKVSLTDNEENSILGKSFEMEKAYRDLRNENKAGFSRKRVVKCEAGERKRYSFKICSKYNGKQIQVFWARSITEYTIFSTSKHGTFREKVQKAKLNYRV